MQEVLLFYNINMILKHSIANISCRPCITVHIMQVVFFSINPYGLYKVVQIWPGLICV